MAAAAMSLNANVQPPSNTKLKLKCGPAPVLQTRVYVAPSHYSITDFEHIAQDPDLTKHITEIVFLAVANDGPGCSNRESSREEFKAECEDLINEGRVAVPSFLAIDDGELEKAFDVYEKMLDDYLFYDDGDLQERLREAMGEMQKVRKVRIQTQVDKDGLNDDRYFFADSYPRSGEHQKAYAHSDDIRERLAWAALKPMRCTNGIYDFLSALSRAHSGEITHLRIGNGLADQLPYSLMENEHEEADPRDQLMDFAPHLLALKVSCCGKKDDEADYFGGGATKEWRGFFSAASNLQKLSVYPETSPGEENPEYLAEYGTILSDILPHVVFPKLNSLSIIGKRLQPGQVRAIWLRAFLSRHAPTLRELELRGIIPVNMYSPEKSARTMEFAIKHIRSDLIAASSFSTDAASMDQIAL